MDLCWTAAVISRLGQAEDTRWHISVACGKEQGEQEPEASRLFSEIVSTPRGPIIPWSDAACCWDVLPGPQRLSALACSKSFSSSLSVTHPKPAGHFAVHS